MYTLSLTQKLMDPAPTEAQAALLKPKAAESECDATAVAPAAKLRKPDAVLLCPPGTVE